MVLNLIIVIQPHPQFGWRPFLYAADRDVNEGWRIIGVPVKETLRKEGASQAVLDLVQAVDDISDNNLINAYSRQKDKTKIDQSVIENLIRPRIEKNCSKILSLAEELNLPFFYREKSTQKYFSSFNEIELLPEKSKCIFNFIKDEDGLRYFIRVMNANRAVDLQQPIVHILSQEPCIVLFGKDIHRIESIDAKKLLPFFLKDYILVPAVSEKAYIQKFVIKTIPQYEVNIEGIDMKERTPEKRAVLALEEDFYQQLALSLSFQYDEQRLTPTTVKNKKIVGVEGADGKEHIVWFTRDSEWEQTKIDFLESLGLQRKGDSRFYVDCDSDSLYHKGLIAWLSEYKDDLNDFIVEQETNYKYYYGAVEMKIALDSQIDWFDLNIEVVLDTITIPFGQFKNHILAGNQEYILPDGRIFILPEEWFTRFYAHALHGEPTDRGLSLKKAHVGLLSEFQQETKSFQLDMDAKNLPPVPANLESVLRPYQKKGFYWLNNLREQSFGACLADDMGLGKTIQSIALLQYVYNSAPQEHENIVSEDEPQEGQLSLFNEPKSSLPASLVVVPKSLIFNWKNELRKFAPGLKVYIHDGLHRVKSSELGKIFKHYQVVISSYGVIRNDINYLELYKFHYIILDESQYIKNPDSIIYEAVMKLRANHKITLTGTPIENSLSDLWAQLNFINPNLLGTYSSFKKNYIQRIEKEHDHGLKETLLKLINPFVLRRTKEEVTPDLPPLTQEIVYCDMSEAQEEAYSREKNSIRNRLLENKEHFMKDRFVALQSLMRLRLLANHPYMANPEYAGDSGKFEQILSSFESIQAAGHKVLIFSSFVKHLNLLLEVFKEKGWKYAMLTGQTKDREKEIARFKDKDVNCFFISLKAGGTGLNLTSADYVFIIDPWWNPASEQQALSRAHRIGQDKSVMVYRFITNDSIEEKIIRLQETKRQLAETMIDSYNPLDNLNNEEIEDLLMS